MLFFKKGLNHIIKAKINYFNKIGNDENFKLHSKQYMKYIKRLQSRIRNKYALYTAKYITKYIRKSRVFSSKDKTKEPSKKPQNKSNQNFFIRKIPLSYHDTFLMHTILCFTNNRTVSSESERFLLRYKRPKHAF